MNRRSYLCLYVYDNSKEFKIGIAGFSIYGTKSEKLRFYLGSSSRNFFSPPNSKCHRGPWLYIYIPLCLQQKCDQYWPKSGLLGIYGRLQVALVCQDVQESYTLRVLRLKLLRIEGENQLVDDQDCPERDVLHFQYTAWPDHGTPETAGQLLAFIQKSSQSSRDTDGPIVVHCR